jgi:hypothetical protein
VDHGVVHAYNKMHVMFKVQVEWVLLGSRGSEETDENI